MRYLFFQNTYDIDELKKPLQNSPQFSSGTDAPHFRTHTGPEKRSLQERPHRKQSRSVDANIPDLREYISQIVWDADHNLDSLPADTVHFYCLEGQCSPAGSLSSLDSANVDEDLNYDYIQKWGTNFDKLKELYKHSNQCS